MHWHLDVTFTEDTCRVRLGHALRNLSTLCELALTLLRREPTKMNLPLKRKKAPRDDNYLQQLLRQLAPQLPDAN